MQTARRIFFLHPPRLSSQFRGAGRMLGGSEEQPCFPDISCKAERRSRIGVLFRARAFKLIIDGRILSPPLPLLSPRPHAPCLSLASLCVSKPEAIRRNGRERVRKGSNNAELAERKVRGSVVHTTRVDGWWRVGVRVDGTVRINMEISQIKLVGEVSSSFSGR